MSSLGRSIMKRTGRRAGKRVFGALAGPLLRALRGLAPKLPPKWDATGRFGRKMRFVASTAGTNLALVSANDIFACLGGTCTTANSVLTCWFSSFRISQICVFLPGGSTASIIWASPTPGLGPDTEPTTAILTNNTIPHCIVSKPPSHSMSDRWVNSAETGTTLMFTISVPQSAVIDVQLAFTLSNNFTPQQTTITAGTLANPYYLALDGPTTNNMRPVDLPTTH
jgi:hypothetical protein